MFSSDRILKLRIRKSTRRSQVPVFPAKWRSHLQAIMNADATQSIEALTQCTRAQAPLRVGMPLV